MPKRSGSHFAEEPTRKSRRLADLASEDAPVEQQVCVHSHLCVLCFQSRSRLQCLEAVKHRSRKQTIGFAPAATFGTKATNKTIKKQLRRSKARTVQHRQEHNDEPEEFYDAQEFLCAPHPAPTTSTNVSTQAEELLFHPHTSPTSSPHSPAHVNNICTCAHTLNACVHICTHARILNTCVQMCTHAHILNMCMHTHACLHVCRNGIHFCIYANMHKH
eukprot:GHVS01073885.1.p1 GENE.GHVS01073885.1~~GHVS01073885.1.p1  ORF type:complete len:218 (+),score=17.03 GHVS01073885.1:3-656(+)